MELESTTDDGTVTLYLDGAPVGWKTPGALILDPDLTPAERRFVEAKAHIAFCVFADVDPRTLDDALLDWSARRMTIPDADLAATDDDRFISVMYFVPVEHVSRARRERRLRVQEQVVYSLRFRRRPR